MASAAVQVKGATELRAALRHAQSTGLWKQLTTAHKDAAQVVVKAARPPVRSGRLKGSMRATGSRTMGNAKAGGAGVPYAAAIHFGRTIGNVGRPPGNHKGPNHIAGRPFLTDAAQANQVQIRVQFEQAMDRLCDEIERDGRA